MPFRDERHNLMAFAAPGASRGRRCEGCEFKAKCASQGGERLSPFHEASSFGRAFRGETSHFQVLCGDPSLRVRLTEVADAGGESTCVRAHDRSKKKGNGAARALSRPDYS